MDQGLTQARATSGRAASRRRIIRAALAVTMFGLMAGGFGERAARAQAGGGCATPNFAAAQNFVAGDNPIFVTASDFNLDGKTDLAAASFNPATSRCCSATGRAASPGRELRRGLAPSLRHDRRFQPGRPT